MVFVLHGFIASRRLRSRAIVAARLPKVMKERLFELLGKVSAKGVNVGEFKLGVAQNEMRFELMLENNWRERIKSPLN